MVTITLLLVAAQHASMTVAGLVVAGYTLGQALTAPLRGRLADRSGLVPVAASLRNRLRAGPARLPAQRGLARPGRMGNRHRGAGRPAQPAAQPGHAQPVVRARGRPSQADRFRAGRRGVRPGLHRRPGGGQRPGRRHRPRRRPGSAAGTDRRGRSHHQPGARTTKATPATKATQATKATKATRAARTATAAFPAWPAPVRRAARAAGDRGPDQRRPQRDRSGAHRLRPAPPCPVGVGPAAGRSLGRQHSRQPPARRPGRPARRACRRLPVPAAAPAAGRLHRRPRRTHRGRTVPSAAGRRRAAGRLVPRPDAGHLVRRGG